MRFSSRYFVTGSGSGHVGFLYSLVAFLFGWWGIPWGPIYTLKSIGSNIAGGSRTDVAAILHGLEKA